MPSKSEIQKRIIGAKQQSQDVVRRQYLSELAKFTGRDTIVYCSAFASGKIQNLPRLAVSLTLEDIQAFMAALHGLSGGALDLILHSGGGSAEAAEQLVQYLRSKYQDIRVIIPQNAMSAATMLACASDSIVMGRQSAIGPIDPQITFPVGQGHHQAPAQSILDEFEQAKAEVTKDPKLAAVWHPRIASYPHGLLKQCEVACQRAQTLVGEWLYCYHFKKAKGSKRKSTSIAKWLSDSSKHLSHGKPISYDVAKDKGLNVARLEDDQEFQDKVLSVFHAAMVTFEVTNCVKFVENHNGNGVFIQVQVQQPGPS